MFRFKASTFQPDSLERLNSLKDVPLASFTARAIAFLFDFLIIIAIIVAFQLSTILNQIHKMDASKDYKISIGPQSLEETMTKSENDYHIDPFHGWNILAFVIYSGVLTYLCKGRTLGKLIMRIKVISLTHNHLSLWHSIERSLGYGASVLEGGFGFIQYFVHPNHQTVHDRIAETIVISVRKKKDPDKINS